MDRHESQVNATARGLALVQFCGRNPDIIRKWRFRHHRRPSDRGRRGASAHRVRNRRIALDPITFFRAVLGHAEIGGRA
jgi:hypothetical protein